ncbi:MAG: hypothetical protein MUC33_14690 [Desulfobacterales bacterium]|nr:hypothetical protein [Desulfobacterales bacterium]
MQPTPMRRACIRSQGILFLSALAIFLAASSPQAATILFQDDFKSGVPNQWRLEPGWQVVDDGGNFVLAGSGHSFARAGDRNWSNYRFKAKVKLTGAAAAVHINYRDICERYFIGFNSGALYLNRTKPCGTHTGLVNIAENHAPGQWYTVEIVGRLGNIKVYLDGSLKIDHTDSDPVLAGAISFESLQSQAVHIDDVLVTTDESLASVRWDSTGGPLGGLGYDVRIHPANKLTMFVTDNFAGVAKSKNGGSSWYQANSGITTKSGPTADAFNIFSLTIDPNQPDIVWAGTYGEGAAFGVFKSTDGGESWVMKTSGIALEGAVGLVFRGFTIQPGDSNVVYAQAEVPTTQNGWEFNRVKGRVYKTVNGGESWIKIWEGENLARYLIVHPDNPAILYLSTGIFDREAWNSDCRNGIPGGVGVLKSTNGGQTWSAVNTGLTDLYVGSLRMHPSYPQILFAATGNNACSGQYRGKVAGGLFRTADGGASWNQVIAGDILTTVNFSQLHPAIVYAGSFNAFYRSDDGGLTWERLAKPWGYKYGPPGISAGFPIDVVVDPDDYDRLYVNNYGGGVFRSLDGAATWEVWSQGYTGAEVNDVVIPAWGSQTVFAMARSGIFVSPSMGSKWIGLANGPEALTVAEGRSVAPHPTNTKLILISDDHQGLVLRTLDGGANWEEVLRQPQANASDPARRQGMKSLAFAPSDPRVVYAGLAKERLSVLTTTPAGTVIYKSTDAGQTFGPLPSILDGSNVNKLFVSPTDSAVVYAATSSGVYRTTNGAATWSKLSGLGSRYIEALAMDFRSPGYLIAGEVFGGIWISADGGSNWTGPHNSGFNSPNPYVTALVFDPLRPETVFAGDLYSGTYRSLDRGLTWAAFPDWKMSGLAVRAVKDMDVNRQVIYAATQGGGVFRYLRPAPRPVPNPGIPSLLLDE